MSIFPFFFLICLIIQSITSKPVFKEAMNLVGLGWKKVPERDRLGHLEGQKSALEKINESFYQAKNAANDHLGFGNFRNAYSHEMNALQRQKSVVRHTSNIAVLQEPGPVKMKTLKVKPGMPTLHRSDKVRLKNGYNGKIRQVKDDDKSLFLVGQHVMKEKYQTMSWPASERAAARDRERGYNGSTELLNHSKQIVSKKADFHDKNIQVLNQPGKVTVQRLRNGEWIFDKHYPPTKTNKYFDRTYDGTLVHGKGSTFDKMKAKVGLPGKSRIVPENEKTRHFEAQQNLLKSKNEKLELHKFSIDDAKKTFRPQLEKYWKKKEANAAKKVQRYTKNVLVLSTSDQVKMQRTKSGHLNFEPVH